MLEKRETSEVFTPVTPANLTYIPRSDAEKQFKRALNTIGKQIVVYGHTGSGKTTMLYNILKDFNKTAITSRCTRGLSIHELLYDAFNQIGSYYTDQTESEKGNKIKTKLGIPLFSFNFGIESSENEKEIRKRIVEFQKNPNQLAKTLGELEVIWVIEDFHKLDSEPKRELSQIMKVFMDIANEYPKTKIIAVGAVDSARQVVHYDKEMENRISEINVPLMSHEELLHIINKGEELLNIIFTDTIKEKIAAYSSGLASVTHQLCSLACESKAITQTKTNRIILNDYDLEYAISEYVNEKSDSLKSIYEQAIKEKAKRTYDNPDKILIACLRLDKETFTILEICKEMTSQDKNYLSNNLRKHVLELTQPNRGEILRYNTNADSFSFSSPFIKGYCLIHLIKYSKRSKNLISKENMEVEQLKKYLSQEYKKFMQDFYDLEN